MLEKVPAIKKKSHFLNLIARLQLLRQLKSYGLDPKEWKFESFHPGNGRDGSAIITNRKDQNLKIRGRALKNYFPNKNGDLWFWEDLSWDL